MIEEIARCLVTIRADRLNCLYFINSGFATNPSPFAKCKGKDDETWDGFFPSAAYLGTLIDIFPSIQSESAASFILTGLCEQLEGKRFSPMLSPFLIVIFSSLTTLFPLGFRLFNGAEQEISRLLNLLCNKVLNETWNQAASLQPAPTPVQPVATTHQPLANSGSQSSSTKLSFRQTSSANSNPSSNPAAKQTSKTVLSPFHPLPPS